MPTAICKSCGKVWHWRNTRGSSIRDLRCDCGGPVVAATRKDGRWIPRQPHAASRQAAYCPICGAKRFAGSTNTQSPGWAFKQPGSSQIYPPGTTVCWTHRVIPIRLATLLDVLRMAEVGRRYLTSKPENRRPEDYLAWAEAQGVVIDDRDMAARVLHEVITRYDDSPWLAMYGGYRDQPMPGVAELLEAERK